MNMTITPAQLFALLSERSKNQARLDELGIDAAAQQLRTLLLSIRALLLLLMQLRGQIEIPRLQKLLELTGDDMSAAVYLAARPADLRRLLRELEAEIHAALQRQSIEQSKRTSRALEVVNDHALQPDPGLVLALADLPWTAAISDLLPLVDGQAAESAARLFVGRN